jgi:hypothetical protein
MGYGRSYDIGVFGSTFGHTVTQNLPVLAVQLIRPPAFFESVFNLAEGPPPPDFPEVPASGRFPLPDQVATYALRRADAAHGRRLEPDRPAAALGQPLV